MTITAFLLAWWWIIFAPFVIGIVLFGAFIVIIASLFFGFAFSLIRAIFD